MSTQNAITQDARWWSGYNFEADNALDTSFTALRTRNITKCFEHLQIAMRQYGWEFHPDAKARQLWKIQEGLAVQLANLVTGCNAVSVAIEDLFYRTYRAVHCDRNRRFRRNIPPRDPAARIEPVIGLGIASNHANVKLRSLR